MSLLNRIQSTLAAPVPVLAAAGPSLPVVTAPDHIVDLDHRDAFIAACLGCKDDGRKQEQIYRHMSEQGMNRATLDAAIKIIIKSTDAALAARFGGTAQPLVLRTAAEWAAVSPGRSDGTYTVVTLKCR